MENEKSQMQLIKEYIETCSLLKNNKINVDYLNSKDYSYSIDRTPVSPIAKRYRDGGAIKQIAFDFSITFPIGSKALLNLINSKFCEDFMKWVENQNNKDKQHNKLPVTGGINSAFVIVVAVILMMFGFKIYSYNRKQ